MFNIFFAYDERCIIIVIIIINTPLMRHESVIWRIVGALYSSIANKDWSFIRLFIYLERTILVFENSDIPESDQQWGNDNLMSNKLTKSIKSQQLRTQRSPLFMSLNPEMGL